MRGELLRVHTNPMMSAEGGTIFVCILLYYSHLWAEAVAANNATMDYYSEDTTLFSGDALLNATEVDETPLICPQGKVLCRDNLSCIPSFGLCDGVPYGCADNSDEDPDVCRQHECIKPFIKCRDGLQCVSKSNFCNKDDRGMNQYNCRDKSDESVWGCAQIGRSCGGNATSEQIGITPLLWPCRDDDDTAQCLDASKVCDSSRGLEFNNCEHYEDEEEDFCSAWSCLPNHVKCSSQQECVHLAGLCDGHPQCSDASDESGLTSLAGYEKPIEGVNVFAADDGDSDFPVNNCSAQGSWCVRVSRQQQWTDKKQPLGIRCSPEVCLEAEKFCDGICHCDNGEGATCWDEHTALCQAWPCSRGHFKCRYSGRCVSSDRVCDGNFDCSRAGVSDDFSDEADCPCSQGSDFRLYQDPTNTCKISVVTASLFEQSLISVDMENQCGLVPCNMSRVELGANDVLPLELGRSEVHPENCASQHLFSHRLEQRIVSALLLERGLSGCECDFGSLGRVAFFNEYPLPSAAYRDMRTYFYRQLSAKTGQLELVHGVSLGCGLEDQDIYEIRLNKIFPTVSYGPGLPSDDKNFPIRVLLHQEHKKPCLSKHSVAAKNLLSLLQLLEENTLLQKDGSPWQPLPEMTRSILRNLICDDPDTEVFQYIYERSNVTFLILAGHVTDLQLSFEVANQRRGLYKEHHLRDKNFTKHVEIMVKNDEQNLRKIGNKYLFHELYIQEKYNITLEQDFVFTRLLFPRSHRHYAQKSGSLSLKAALESFSIKSPAVDYYRLCKPVQCAMESLTDPLQIERSLSARWLVECFNVKLPNGNEYVIEPTSSSVDTVYIMLERNSKVLVRKQDEDSRQWPTLHQKLLRGDGRDSVQALQTRLLWVKGKLFCPNEAILTFREFYIPTLVSAFMRNNSGCVEELCADRSFYFQSRGFNFLGPFDAIWRSRCLEEFGFDVVSTILQAESYGVVTMNKFWAFENYNYLVFSSSSSFEGQKSESMYLSATGLSVEVILGSVMALVCVTTVCGNLLVFVAILIDPVVKKSVYQYFQMSLCLADVLMGIAGAGSIVITQFSLLTGYLTLQDFLGREHTFRASFEQPQEAQRSGLNLFYFITQRPSHVIAGAMVSLSTTVSLLLLSAMAFTRHQVVAASTKQHRVFKLAVRHPVAASIMPWIVGLLFTCLYFLDAFFDPVSKLTILGSCGKLPLWLECWKFASFQIPSAEHPLVFFVNTGFAAAVSLVTIFYSVKAWMAINVNASQQYQLSKRLAEERKWLYLTLAIILAFTLSVVPVFLFYLLSIMHVRLPAQLQLLVWWLLVSGSFMNLIIYTAMNEKMRLSIRHAGQLMLFMLRLSSTDPRIEAAADAQRRTSSHETKTTPISGPASSSLKQASQKPLLAKGKAKRQASQTKMN